MSAFSPYTKTPTGLVGVCMEYDGYEFGTMVAGKGLLSGSFLSSILEKIRAFYIFQDARTHARMHARTHALT